MNKNKTLKKGLEMFLMNYIVVVKTSHVHGIQLDIYYLLLMISISSTVFQ